MQVQFSFPSPFRAILPCGLAFSILAAVLKVLFFSYFNPSLPWHSLIAFFIATVFWYWLVVRHEKITIIRAGSIGALIGLLTPPLTWLLYGVYLLVTVAKPVEALGWALAYAWIMLIKIGPFSLLLGILIGIGLAYVEPERRQ